MENSSYWIQFEFWLEMPHFELAHWFGIQRAIPRTIPICFPFVDLPLWLLILQCSAAHWFVSQWFAAHWFVSQWFTSHWFVPHWFVSQWSCIGWLTAEKQRLPGDPAPAHPPDQPARKIHFRRTQTNYWDKFWDTPMLVGYQWQSIDNINILNGTNWRII